MEVALRTTSYIGKSTYEWNLSITHVFGYPNGWILWCYSWLHPSSYLSYMHERFDASFCCVWCCKAMAKGLTIHWELASKYMSMLIDSQPTKLWYSTHVAENKNFLCQSLLMEYAASTHTCINSKVTTPKNVGRSKASNDTFSCRHGKWTRSHAFEVITHVRQSQFSWVSVAYIDQSLIIVIVFILNPNHACIWRVDDW